MIALLLLVVGYLAGRLHQWHRRANEQDESYRFGYDQASKSLLSFVVRQQGVERQAQEDAGARTVRLWPVKDSLRAR